MKNFTIAKKLALLGLLFMIPFTTVTYMMVSSINSEKVDFANLELMGTRYNGPLAALLVDLQEHNSSAVTWLGGDASYQQAVVSKADDIENDIAKVNDVDRELNSALHTTEEWKALRASIEELLKQTPRFSMEESLAEHQKAIDATVLMISKVSDSSKLTLDPDMDTYYLMNVLMFQAPTTIQFLSQAQGLTSLMSAEAAGTPDQYSELDRLAILADFSKDGMVDSYNRASGFNQSLVPELADAMKATADGVKVVTTEVRNFVATSTVDANNHAIDTSLGKNIAAMNDLQKRTTTSLNRLLQARVQRWQGEVNTTLACSGSCLAVVLLISFYLIRDITVPLQRMVGIANEIAAGRGNYSARANKRGNDELGVLIDAFNEMLTQIQTRDGDLHKSHLELEKRVADRTQEVVSSLSLIHATLESTTDGILVTDATGNPTSFNGKFLEMWKIPGQSEPIPDRQVTRTMSSPMSDDYTLFLRRIRELLTEPDKDSFDLLQLKDGRLFEQYSKPQRVNNRTVGRVWSFRDITERVRVEKEMDEMHRQLLDSSRQAGMAEVATSVLHNVGNVLNSVNISCSVIASVIQKSKAENLNKVVEMLAAHEADLGLYLTTDPKGRQLPGYLRQLSQHLHTQHGAALQEITRLQENIDHIKEIVVMQQSHAKVSGMVESLTLTSLVDDALRLNQGSLQRDGVEVIKDYADILPMEVEKHKILQILVNLIRNAKHACDESANAEKRIVIQVVGGSDRISVSVIDNGVGIPAENLKRIFGHGFTTRKEGHGFGLHSSALAAKEMGGFITVESEGPGRGAKFTLDLPYVRTITNSGNIRRLIEPARAA